MQINSAENETGYVKPIIDYSIHIREGEIKQPRWRKTFQDDRIAQRRDTQPRMS